MGKTESALAETRRPQLGLDRRHLTLLAGTLFFALSFTAKAQDQATLVGSVTDASGAAIPGAKVTVTRPDVGFTRDLVTNSAGEYTAARIPIGEYVITAEATGFQKLVPSGITLQVGQTLRVDLQMTVGKVNQEVTVKGSAVKVETENATVSDVVSGGQIQDLTLVGRNYQMLTILTPGAAPEDSWDPTKLGHNSQAGISFNGTRDYYNNFEIEGAQNNDTSSGGRPRTHFPPLTPSRSSAFPRRTTGQTSVCAPAPTSRSSRNRGRKSSMETPTNLFVTTIWTPTIGS